MTATSGKPPVTGEAIQDAIELPHAVGGKPGEIEAIIPFLNPAFVGKFVFHCHISDHSDHGMMANIVVLPRKTVAENLWDQLRRYAGLGGPAADDDLLAANDVPLDFRGAVCGDPVIGSDEPVIDR